MKQRNRIIAILAESLIGKRTVCIAMMVLLLSAAVPAAEPSVFVFAESKALEAAVRDGAAFSGQYPITLQVNGKKISSDASPIIVKNRTLIPVRAVFEKAGADVSWNADTGKVKITYGGSKIQLTIGSRTAVVNGVEKSMEVPALIINGRTMIPVRFVAESMNLKVSWNNSTRTVNVITRKPGDPVSVKTYGALGNGVVDDTAAIQAAIDDMYEQGGGTVNIPDGTYRINPDKSIRMKSNIKLHLSEDAILKAKPSRNASYYIVLMYDISNASLTGGKIVGERDQHIGTGGQWGHGIAIRGCNNIYMSDISVSDCWGDGIYIGSTEKQHYSKDVVIERYDIENNRRQGISVISAKNLLLKDGVISNTNGSDPQRGIDFEPNHSTEFMQNVIVENLRTYRNAGYGIGFWLVNIEGTAHEVSITIKNYVDIGSRSAFNGQLKNNEFVKNNVVII